MRGRFAMIVAGVVACMVVVCLTDVSAGGGGLFDGLSKAKHIYGDKVTAKDLKGKVVFLEYWGVHCPPCRASFPHLVKLQKKYAKTGKFTVLASHRQMTAEEAKQFCASQHVNFPVYHMYTVKGAPCGRGIPHAVLIDHTGKVVKAGHPSELYDMVAKLVKETPTPPAPILGGLKVKFWKSQAKALGAGGPVLGVLNLLRNSSGGGTPKAEEAAKIVKAVEHYLDSRTKSLLALAENKPALAYNEIKPFLRQVSGMEVGASLKDVYAKLNSDPAVKALAAVRLEIDKVRAALAKRETRSGQKKLLALKAKALKVADRSGASSALISEAKELADSL